MAKAAIFEPMGMDAARGAIVLHDRATESPKELKLGSDFDLAGGPLVRSDPLVGQLANGSEGVGAVRMRGLYHDDDDVYMCWCLPVLNDTRVFT